jgi:hypothetical protein
MTKRGDVNRLAYAPFQEAALDPALDPAPGTDSELLNLCDECRRAHAVWVAYFNFLADDAVTRAPASEELAHLRAAWRKALDRVCELPPVTLSGALAKHDLACMLKAWSGEDDVFEFLALTSREICAVLCSLEVARGGLNGSKARRNGSSRVGWLDRVVRFSRSAKGQRAITDRTVRRSQT